MNFDFEIWSIDCIYFHFAEAKMAKKQDIMFSIGEDVDDENQSADSASSSSVSDSIPIPGSLGREPAPFTLSSPERTTIERTTIQTIAASAAELSMSPRTFLR